MTGESRVAGAQAIRRSMDVVRAVAQMQRTGASLSRVASATGLNRSTAFRILRSLCEERMLRFDEVQHSYYLGLLAFEFGLAAQAQSQVRSYWAGPLEEIAASTRLTAYLMARSDTEAVCLLCQQGSATIRAMPLDEGQRLPLGIGAGSLAILSTLDDAEIDEVLAVNCSRLNLFPGRGEQAPAIRERVRASRLQGFAVSAGSVGPGLIGVGVPVLPRTGLLQLAVSVSAVADDIEMAEAQQFASVIGAAIRKRLASG